MPKLSQMQIIENLENHLAVAVAAKDSAYHERDMVVAALSKLLPACLERHPEEDITWETEWRWIVFIRLPDGSQTSWHIHDSELPMFDHLPRLVGEKWDGHSTELKYQRLESLEVRK